MTSIIHELRSMAASVGLAVPQAATLMMGAADTIDRLDADNAKLRELVDGLTWCYEHYGCRQECPLYDVSEPDHCLEVSIKRELGIEVEQ